MIRTREATSWGELAWFSRTDDGQVSLDSAAWPKRIEVTEGFLKAADPRFVRESGWRILSFGVTNGWAVYRRVLFDRGVNGIRRYTLRACELENGGSEADSG